VVDLDKLPSVPSLFDDELRGMRWVIQFLRDFREELIRPVQPDSSVHIEYVPTQIVTEYLRLWFPADGETIDGVVYTSSRAADGRCVVLFVDNERCIEAKQEATIDRLCLRLVSSTLR
jgi:hypothetical protein